MKFKNRITKGRRKEKRKTKLEVGGANGFIDFCKRKKWVLILLCVLALFVSVSLYLTGSKEPEGLLISEDGQVIAVDMEKAANGQTSLNVKAVLGDTSIQKDVVIKHESKIEKKTDISFSDAEKISLDVARIVRDINRGNSKFIELPQISSEGVSMSWHVPERGMEYIMPLFFPLLIMFFSYRSVMDKEKQSVKEEHESILRELPAFNNKLVLLMESGLIYDEAVERISERGKGRIEDIFLKAINDARSTNGRLEKLVGDYAREKKLSELSRLVSIISESRERGTDLREKLRGEGEILWEKRKRHAEEQGKLVDTKLALPLGMMLISLLLVTAAPALMQF